MCNSNAIRREPCLMALVHCDVSSLDMSGEELPEERFCGNDVLSIQSRDRRIETFQRISHFALVPTV
jgi:hypothetical protein